MPKRVIDFDAMWGSDKLASCAAWAQPEYAWLYGLADASGCFEVTNLRVIWGRVAAIRGNFTIERLEQVFAEFQDKGLLFVWEYEGKRYAHWTGSDVPGRLPPPSWRMRLEKFAPPVPKQKLAEYMARFARGRAAMAGGGFRAEAGRAEMEGNLKFESSDLRDERGGIKGGGIKGGVEEAQAQDWNLNLGLDRKLKGKWEAGGVRAAEPAGRNGDREIVKSNSYDSSSQADANANSKANEFLNSSAGANSNATSTANSKATVIENSNANLNATSNANALNRENLKANADARAELDPSVGAYGRANAASQACGSSSCNSRQGLTAIADVNWGFVSGAGEAHVASRVQPRVFGISAKELAVERELRVGQGPVCGPVGIRAEVLERIRLREAARAKTGTRSP